MPTIAELFDLAVRHHQKGELRQAEPLYRQVLQAEPAHAGAHQMLGLLAHQAGRHEVGVTLIRRAIALDPTNAGCQSNLGMILKEQGRLDEATECFRQAVALDPGFVDGLSNLGLALKEQGDIDGAIEGFRQALRINPDHAVASYNLGNIFKNQGQLAESAQCYRQALRGNPRYAAAHNNLGNVLADVGQLTEAAACFDQALRLEPNRATTRWNLACLRLLQGDFPAAWPDYECRSQIPGFATGHNDRPRWDGSPFEGKTILIHAEQGMGDTIHFIRYAPLVKERGGTVLFECQPPLKALLTGIAGVERIIDAAEPLPTFDVQAPLLSLPGIFATSPATIPASVPYLRPNADLVAYWRKELATLGRFKVGIAWQGNPKHRGDRNRSIALAHFEALARVEGVGLVSLQKGPGTDQIASMAGRFPILDLGDRLDAAGAFLDTAAIMMNLDLVVAADSAVAHLAGALGAPAWVALSVAPDWRWLLDRADSPWYPTMRLFRQRRYGDWGDVFDRIAAEVRLRIAN